MGKEKQIREKGKLSLSRYFKKIDVGNSVAVTIEPSVNYGFPKRIQGMSGEVVGERGASKIVEIKFGSKMKTYIIHPVHLKKLEKA
jgi:large subunit ribosomal protein L21e